METEADLKNWIAAEKSLIRQNLDACESERLEVLGELQDLEIAERTLARLMPQSRPGVFTTHLDADQSGTRDEAFDRSLVTRARGRLSVPKRRRVRLRRNVANAANAPLEA